MRSLLFFCGEYWVGCLVLFYQVSGHGLCLRLTDGCLFLFYLFLYLCWLGFVVDKIAVGVLLFCYKNYT